MRILLLNQYYLPDMAPTGRFLHDVGKDLVARGHDVTVWCSRKSYNGGDRDYERSEDIDGVHIKRIRALGFGRKTHLGKLADYATFYALLARRCLIAGKRKFPAFDVVVSLTTPPFVGILGNIVARRCGAKSIQWVMDLYPDVMAAHGMMEHGDWKHKILAPLTRWQFNHSDQVWALGPYQRKKIEQYVTEIEESKRPQVIDVPLWRQICGSTESSPGMNDAIAERRKELGWENALGVMYSGNMGLGHRFETIMAAIERLDHEEKHRAAAQSSEDANAQKTAPAKARFAFVGGGKRRAWIEQYIEDQQLSNTSVSCYVDNEKLAANLLAADLHLVSLDPEWQGLIVPSKLMNILSSGRAVLFVGPMENEIAQWIRESGGGWTVDTKDIDGCVAALREALNNPEERRRRAQAGMRFSRERFSTEHNVQLLADCVLNEELPEELMSRERETSYADEPFRGRPSNEEMQAVEVSTQR